MAYASQTFLNGIHEKSKFKNSQNQISSASGSNIGTYGNLGLSALGLMYNIFGNERSNRQQEYWNRLSQSNFENQFQIASADLQKAGFNPSAILGGASQNSAPSGNVASQNPVDVPAMISAVTQSKIAKSQIELYQSLAEKNRIESAHIANDYDWRTGEREASQEFISSESEKQRTWQHSEGERQRHFDKWQTEYNAWVRQNEGVLERNLHRQLYNASVKEKLEFRKLDYKAELNLRSVAHKFNISENVIDNTSKMVCQRLLDNNEFIHKFILQKDDQEAQMKLLDQAFANSLSEELIRQDFVKSQDFKKGVMSMLSSFVSIGLLKM